MSETVAPSEQIIPETTIPQPVTPKVPNGNKKNSLPWFLWIFAGCGCLGFLIVPLFVIAIVVINPMGKITSSLNASYTKEIESTGNSVIDCISAEKAKGVTNDKIFSLEACANKDYLFDNHYTETSILSDIRLLVSPAKSKVCAYLSYYNFQTKHDILLSWDSVKGMAADGKGTKICADLAKEVPTATNSATVSAK